MRVGGFGVGVGGLVFGLYHLPLFILHFFHAAPTPTPNPTGSWKCTVHRDPRPWLRQVLIYSIQLLGLALTSPGGMKQPRGSLRRQIDNPSTIFDTQEKRNDIPKYTKCEKNHPNKLKYMEYIYANILRKKRSVYLCISLYILYTIQFPLGHRVLPQCVSVL